MVTKDLWMACNSKTLGSCKDFYLFVALPKTLVLLLGGPFGGRMEDLRRLFQASCSRLVIFSCTYFPSLEISCLVYLARVNKT